MLQKALLLIDVLELKLILILSLQSSQYICPKKKLNELKHLQILDSTITLSATDRYRGGDGFDFRPKSRH